MARFPARLLLTALLATQACLLPDLSVRDVASGGAGGAAGHSGASGSADMRAPFVDRAEYAYADWPIPDRLAGSRVSPSYTTTAINVIDDVTHLIWQRQMPDVYAGCTGTDDEHTLPAGSRCFWLEAIAYCKRADVAAALGGGAGWRLPTKIELESIIDETRFPAIDAIVFPGIPGDLELLKATKFYTSWTTTPAAGETTHPYFVQAASGLSAGHGRTDVACHVRCVRSSVASLGPADRYEIGSDTVEDKRTGLVWQRVVHGSMYMWPDAKTYCAQLGLGGAQWRLPAYKELLTLVDPTRSDPSIDTSAFPDTPADWFWSGSSFSEGRPYAVEFKTGQGDFPVDEPHHVRCVR